MVQLLLRVADSILNEHVLLMADSPASTSCPNHSGYAGCTQHFSQQKHGSDIKNATPLKSNE